MVSKLINKTVEELKDICRQKNITGYSKLNKEKLIKLVKKNSKIKNEKVEKSKKGGVVSLKRSDSDIREAVHLWINNKEQAKQRYGYINKWDTSKVTDMSYLFCGDNTQGGNNIMRTHKLKGIENWNVSNVTNMSYMFHLAKDFNGPIGSWNVSNVQNMTNMFYGAESFDKSIDRWNVSKVTNMYSMFLGAQSFNQPIDSWDVSNVTNMSLMFCFTRNFNKPINSWDVQNVEDMNGMFHASLSFNKPIGSWNVSNVKNMQTMFSSARDFNQDISNWNVTNVSEYDHIFENCPINDDFKPNFREINNFQRIITPSTYISQNMLKSNNNTQNMSRSNNNTCRISEVYTKLYNHILKVDDNILRDQPFIFESQEGINAGGLSRTVFDLFYKTYFHKFFKYIDNNNKDLGIILKNTKNNKNMDQFYNATNKLIMLARKGDLKIFMLINKTLFDLLKSDDPIQQINLNKKNIYDKEGSLKNNYRKGVLGDSSKISDVILYNKNNSKWNINFKDIKNNNKKKEVYFRRYLQSLGFESDNHFIWMKQLIKNYWLEHPTLFSNEMPSYLKKDFIKRIKLIEQGNEIEKNLTTNILTNKSKNSIITKYPNVKVLLEYILNDNNDEYRKKFCNWATGSIYSCENIKIKLYQMQNEVPFISHTCFNRVDVFQTAKSPYFNNIRQLNKQINSEQKLFSVA